MLDAFIAWLASIPPLYLYAILMVLSALENVFPPVPADVAVALGAFLSQRGVTSAPLLGLACWGANVGSAAALYYVARRNADFFRHGWPKKLLPPEAMAALEQAYRRHGMLGIFVSRFLPGVRAAVTPFAGVFGLSPPRALLPTAAASGIWYFLLVVAGVTVGEEWAYVRHVVERVLGALGGLSVVATLVVVIWLWRRARVPRTDDPS
jgi:membrane protein DedA with SNARE-associated domain